MPETRMQTRQKNEPVDSSTPRTGTISIGLTARRSIHEQFDGHTSMPSPIQPNISKVLEELNQEPNSESCSDSGLSDSDSELQEPNELSTRSREASIHREPVYIPESASLLTSTPNTSTGRVIDTSNWTLYMWFFLAFLLVSVSTRLVFNSKGDNDVSSIPITLKDLQANFPLQSKELWQAFRSGIKEVREFDKPSVFFLLYDEKSEDTVNRLVHKISQYGMCEIKGDCTLAPITLSNEVLSTKKALLDYGNLIEEYKNELENKGVMIINNIENVKGTVAQVFHSMCDEYTPLVKHAVFIFTMKLNKFPALPKGDIQLVEDILHNNWKDLEDDLFYPLFTRITNMVLRVLPEVQ